MVQSVKPPTSTQAMISGLRVRGLETLMGSVLTAQSLEPAWDSVSSSLSLSAPPWGAWLSQWVEPATLDLHVLSSSPRLSKHRAYFKQTPQTVFYAIVPNTLIPK